LGVEENALAVYHQSEWGRVSGPATPAAGHIQHDREYGLARFLPGNTGGQRTIDPADRKFFTPGYGTQIVMPGEVRVLPAVARDEVDPDQDIGLLEFFSPEYGPNTVTLGELEVLPAIDPADRKFFSAN
jgi:hypothetical protein